MAKRSDLNGEMSVDPSTIEETLARIRALPPIKGSESSVDAVHAGRAERDRQLDAIWESRQQPKR